MSKLLVKRMHRRLTERQVMHIIARRYGSLTDYSAVIARVCDISKATGIAWSTVNRAIKRFHKNGDQFTDEAAKKTGRKRIVPEHIEE